MKAYICAAVLTCVSLGVSAPALGQGRAGAEELEAIVRRHYEAIDATIVRLRTTADVEIELSNSSSGHRSVMKRPLEVHGTGVIVGRIEVEGRWEYLILTNHHVADPSNYVVHDGRFLRENRHNTRAVPDAPEESFLMMSDTDEASPEDVRLIELARNVKGDMALLRTVNAPEGLPQFTGPIGFAPGGIRPGARVITSGYPAGRPKIIDAGRVVAVDRLHQLGQPHEDFVLSLPVERGQSGSPVFLVEEVPGAGGPEIRFTLIGLLHASERGETFMVPYSLWREAMEPASGALGGRLAR